MKITRVFNNNLFGLRHGHSKANEAGIILSGLEAGKLDDFSLTKLGESQVRQTILSALGSNILNNKTIVISSPFSRCRQTAEIGCEVLGIANKLIIYDERLRERWFGNWEKTDNKNYERVWILDAKNPLHEDEGVESVKAVQERTAQVVLDYDSRFFGENIVFVSHGDALQIQQTWLCGIDPSEHRSLPHLKTAELRKLN